MRELFGVMMEKLEADLAKIEMDENPQKRLVRCQERVKTAIEEVPKMEDFEQFYGDSLTGVLFLKELVPELFRKLLYYHLLFDLQLNKRSSTAEEHKRFCEDQLSRIRKWQTDNYEFIKYYYGNRFEEDDWQFYVKRKGDIPEVLRENLKPPFDYISCAMVATLLAYGDFSKVLRTELQGPDSTFEPATWMGTKTELVEQIIGEHAIGHTLVNGEPATLDYLIARAEKMYSNVSLKNFAVLASQMRRRKEITNYHEKKIKMIKASSEELLDRGKYRY